MESTCFAFDSVDRPPHAADMVAIYWCKKCAPNKRCATKYIDEKSILIVSSFACVAFFAFYLYAENTCIIVANKYDCN